MCVRAREGAVWRERERGGGREREGGADGGRVRICRWRTGATSPLGHGNKVSPDYGFAPGVFSLFSLSFSSQFPSCYYIFSQFLYA